MYYQATDKIAIIGAGNVARALLNNLIGEKIFKEIFLLRGDKGKLEQFVADSQDAAHLQGITIHGCDGIGGIPGDATCIVTASAEFDYSKIARQYGKNLREAIIKYEAPLIKDIAKEFAARENPYEGHIFMITNPTGAMSGILHKYSGLAAEKIHPFGAMLDTIRAETASSRDLKALFIGEHGPSGFVVPELSGIDNDEAETLTRDTHQRGAGIAAGLGYSTGVSGVLMWYLKQLQSGNSERRYIPFGTWYDNTFIEIPATIEDGLIQSATNRLTNASLEKLKASVAKVKRLDDIASKLLSDLECK